MNTNGFVVTHEYSERIFLVTLSLGETLNLNMLRGLQHRLRVLPDRLSGYELLTEADNVWKMDNGH